MNRWKIPDWLEREVIQRDRACVYCRVSFEITSSQVGDWPSWEHIVNDARIITRENIVLCCRSCNSSKGSKLLEIWLESSYCKRRGISKDSVAMVVRHSLQDSGVEQKGLKKTILT
jgi:hypothetical protein